MELRPMGREDDAESDKESSTAVKWRPDSVGRGPKLETMESLDWKRFMAENPDLLGEGFGVEKSPVKYFMGEIYGGSSLRSTISVGNEKKRQRVYNTMFHVPFRCERLIIAGFFVCLDSFLSLLTIMPARILMTIWRLLRTRYLINCVNLLERMFCKFCLALQRILQIVQ
ncbi:hypothetical protein HPP92_020144 [Vanilla planifolia]|uniref:Uncharacterized protein n=1 Tax=Vanilla planifolia TaxID=51239 RepID=A0A835Q469_VANPL|nr:hypothetical protein HPP92_020144 [Vanilla planifolia]